MEIMIKSPDEMNSSKPSLVSDSITGRNDGKRNLFSSKICDWIVNASVVMIFFGMPLFFTGLNLQGLAFEKQIFFYFWILLGIVSWAIKGIIVGEMKIRKTPLDIPIIAFFLVYLLATIFSVDRWHSFWGYFGDPSRGLVGVAAIIAVYYLVFNNFSMKKVKWMLGSLIISNFFIAIWTSFAVMKIPLLPQNILNNIPLSFTGSFSGLTMFFFLMIPLLITAALKIKQAEIKPILKIVALGIIFGALVGNLFSILALYNFVPWPYGWMIMILGIMIFLIYILSGIVKSSWGLAGAVFVVLMVMLFGGKAINIARINLPVEVSLNADISWSIAKSALKEKFLFGSGPGTYGYDFSLFRPQQFNENPLYNLRFYQGTGMFFESLATVGILGLIALIALVLFFLNISFFLLTREKGKDKLYSLGLLTSALMFIVMATMFRIEGVILIIGSMITAFSFATLLKESESQEKNINLSLKASPKFALALAFIFMVITASVIFLFVFIGKAYIADIYAGLSGRSQEIGENSLNRMLRGINLYGKESRYYTQVAQYYLVMANREALKGKDADSNMITFYLNEAIKSGTIAKSISKNDVGIVEALAQIYENSVLYVVDSVNFAEENYKRALELEPHNPTYYLKLGQLKISQAAAKKDENEKKQIFEEAKNLFQKSVDEKNTFDTGYYNLALIQEALGDLDGAIENLGKAYNIDTNNINYNFSLGRLYQRRGGEIDLKNAEILFRNALNINEKEPNIHFQLGLLYEQLKENDKAVEEYRKVLDLIPTDNNETREKIQKMIEDVKNGSGNLNLLKENANPSGVENVQ